MSKQPPVSKQPLDQTIEADSIPDWFFKLRLTARENALYVEAARRAGIETQHWIRQVLNDAASEALGADAFTVGRDLDRG